MAEEYKVRFKMAKISFKHKSNLKKHIELTHEKNQLIKCNICESTFGCNEYLAPSPVTLFVLVLIGLGHFGFGDCSAKSNRSCILSLLTLVKALAYHSGCEASP